MALLLYAVENGTNKGFLVTTTEKYKDDLKKFRNKEFVNDSYLFMYELVKQDIIPVYNKELLNKTNLHIDLNFEFDLNSCIAYSYFFEETYRIGEFKVSFNIEGERVENSIGDLYEANIYAFEITIKDNKENEICIDVFSLTFVNDKEINKELNNKIDNLLNKWEITNKFSLLFKNFEECDTSNNIVELADINDYIDIESFIKEIYKTIIEGINNKN